MAHHNLQSDIIDRHAVVHGFRSTLRNFCAEHDVPFDLAELALAHTLPQVILAYLRSDLLAQRARLMEYYGQHAEGRLAIGWTLVERRPEDDCATCSTRRNYEPTQTVRLPQLTKRADRQIAAAERTRRP